MGQTVEINETVEMGEILVIDTDRSFTGQDGQVITPERPGFAVPGLLAEELFGLGLGIDHVFVLQNVVTLRRPGGWDDDATRRAVGVTGSFLRHYDGGEEE